MKVAPKPANEQERLQALKSYEILDTLPEKDFDDLTLLASQICQTPIALISLVEEERQWFKSKIGLGGTESSRQDAFCSHAILDNKVLVIPNSLEDDRFYDNPFVTNDPHIRFYAGAPLTTADGHNIGSLCVIDNKPRQISPEQISALESLARQVVGQMELRRSLKKLEASQVELQKAKEVAEEAYRVKGEFLANMSHEIRTPMNGIIGLTELLQNSKLDKDQNEKLRMIQSCGQTLLELINEILDFSKLEAGKVQIENRDFNFKELINDTVKMCEIAAIKKNIRLTCAMDPTVPEAIVGDSTRIRQILLNLTSNAIKFTSVGEVKVHVQRLGDPSQKICEMQISVQDTGVGIPPDVQHRLFKSFSQVDASTTRQYGGTGLGLAISKGLCEKMNGRIWFETKQNVGSTFHFTFRTEISANPVAAKKRNDTDVTVVPTTLKILVAEDNPINQTVVQGLLQQFGHDIDIANNGIEALEMLSKKSYDVLFLDCHMPKMDGFETTQNILADSRKYGKPKIVALTASVLEEDKNRCFAAGMDDFLSKPVRSADLKKVLIPLQKKNATARATAQAKPPAPTPAPTSTATKPTPTTSANSEVDFDSFYKAFAKIEHIMGTVIKQYLHDYPVIIQQIERAIKTKDYKDLHVSSHSLKGMLAEIYAPACHKLAYELEQMGKAEKIENAPATVQVLAEKLKVVEADLLQIKTIPKVG